MLTCEVQMNQGNEMSYLKEFQTKIANHDYPACLRLWEEYCSSEEIDPEELKYILQAIKNSEMDELFGRHVEKILPLWEKLPPSSVSHEIFKLLFDIETSNTPTLAELALTYLQNRYGTDPLFSEKIRLIGLRSKDQFQGAISNFELLSHMKKGNYVFHKGGWGVGEIVDVSMVREQLSLEFDYVPGRKDLSFSNAFKTLIPIPDDHFLALRFGSPDELEKKARENPLEVMHMLLRDLGPKTAAEIKDELSDLVIPSTEWAKWWQSARTKMKKDTMIETPEELKDPFRLRQTEITHEERLTKALATNPDANTLIQMVYSFIKDFPETLKNNTFKTTLITKVKETLSSEELTDPQKLQIHFLLEDLQGDKTSPHITEFLKKTSSIEDLIQAIDIISFKKNVFVEIRKNLPNWEEIFLNLLFKVSQNTIKDYLLNELLSSSSLDPLKKKLEDLYTYPFRYPDTFLWYFQKIVSQKSLPFSDKEGKSRFFEAFFVLLNALEQTGTDRDLIKKMHTMLSSDRYAIVRQIMQTATLADVKEFLLLATKCHSLTDHDIKILHSLGEVVHPSLTKGRKKQENAPSDQQIIWTTQEGYNKLQKRIQQIATVETVENAKEIEVARSHGDLRENAEFKSALEKRDRLQSELKLLSDQLNKSRVITPADVSTDKVGIGVIVDCVNKQGQKISYTLLGPWDADPDKYILSFQSKIAQDMKGLSVGEAFKFQGEEYTIAEIRSFFKK